MRALQQAHGELEQLGVRVAGVSTDTWATNAAFAQRYGIGFPLLSDWPERVAVRAFGVAAADGSAQRVTFVFGRAHAIASVITEQDARAHVAQVMEAARALGAG